MSYLEALTKDYNQRIREYNNYQFFKDNDSMDIHLLQEEDEIFTDYNEYTFAIKYLKDQFNYIIQDPRNKNKVKVSIEGSETILEGLLQKDDLKENIEEKKDIEHEQEKEDEQKEDDKQKYIKDEKFVRDYNERIKLFNSLKLKERGKIVELAPISQNDIPTYQHYVNEITFLINDYNNLEKLKENDKQKKNKKIQKKIKRITANPLKPHEQLLIVKNVFFDSWYQVFTAISLLLYTTALSTTSYFIQIGNISIPLVYFITIGLATIITFFTIKLASPGIYKIFPVLIGISALFCIVGTILIFYIGLDSNYKLDTKTLEGLRKTRLQKVTSSHWYWIMQIYVIMVVSSIHYR